MDYGILVKNTEQLGPYPSPRTAMDFEDYFSSVSLHFLNCIIFKKY